MTTATETDQRTEADIRRAVIFAQDAGGTAGRQEMLEYLGIDKDLFSEVVAAAISRGVLVSAHKYDSGSTTYYLCTPTAGLAIRNNKDPDWWADVTDAALKVAMDEMGDEPADEGTEEPAKKGQKTREEIRNERAQAIKHDATLLADFVREHGGKAIRAELVAGLEWSPSKYNNALEWAEKSEQVICRAKRKGSRAVFIYSPDYKETARPAQRYEAIKAEVDDLRKKAEEQKKKAEDRAGWDLDTARDTLEWTFKKPKDDENRKLRVNFYARLLLEAWGKMAEKELRLGEEILAEADELEKTNTPPLTAEELKAEGKVLEVLKLAAKDTGLDAESITEDGVLLMLERMGYVSNPAEPETAEA